MHIDVEKLIEGVHDYISKTVAPLHARIKELEARPLRIETTISGEDILKHVESPEGEAIFKRFAQSLPKPKDGESVTLDQLAPMVKAAVDAIPRPKDGENGPTHEEVSKMVADLFATIPKPADGKSIELKDVLDWLEAKSASWELAFERRANESFQRAIDRMPKPRDGNDGVGWDDMTVEHDGKRMVSFIYKKGEKEYRADIKIPCTIDAGFWKEGMKCEEGDGVTHGGSYWIAQKDTDSKPDIGNPDFRLAVRKGRDAKTERQITRPVLTLG